MFSERLTLIQCNISVWGAERTDRSVSSDVCSSHSADQRAGRFVKNLLGGKCEQLDAIRAVSNACRQWLRANTLSYSTSTVMVPNELLIPTLAKLREFKEEFDTAVGLFIERLDQVIETAQTNSGTLWEGLPPAAVIRSKFSLSYCPTPMPEINDFDRSLGMDDIKESVKLELDAHYQKMFSNAEDELDEMLEERIGAMLLSMSGKKPCGKAILNKTHETLQLIRSLNVRNSAAINAKIAMVQSHISQWTTYRLNSAARESGLLLLKGRVNANV